MSEPDWQALAREVVISEGCAAPCPNHPDVLLDLRLDDDILAERQRAAWLVFVERAKAAGFDGDPDLHLQAELIYAMQAVDEICPHCGVAMDPPDDPDMRRKPHPFLTMGDGQDF